MPRSTAASISEEHVALFSARAEDFWDAKGPFRFLHELGPLRMDYVKDRVRDHLGQGMRNTSVLKGLKILDAGCGGGLLAEALARAGATVTGVDASPEVIAVARRHAKASRLHINYTADSVEALAKKRQRFDVVTAMEIVEHVADRESFLRSLAHLLRPGGLLIMATLNRTVTSYMLGIVIAEYALGWIPRGTHDWETFVRPSELVEELAHRGVTVTDLTGVVFDPWTGTFEKSKENLKVNYLLAAVKDGARLCRMP